VLNSPDAPPATSTGTAASTTLTRGTTSRARPAPATASPGTIGHGGPAGADHPPQPRDPASLQEAANMTRDYVASLPAERFPHMVSLADEFAFADAGERFELLIDIFVDGLARHAAPV
jgi:hypothetical protein